ncbi:MAG: LapA family protein [Mariprofundus sp.]|nr:LapA family protein [Mariprofundus sp.]
MVKPILHLPDIQIVNWINVLVVLVLTSFATMFALENLSTVELSFLSIVSDPIPLYLPVFIAFLFGFGGGVLAMAFSRRKHKEEISSLRAEHDRLQLEVDNLRNIPLQDDV